MGNVHEEYVGLLLCNVPQSVNYQKSWEEEGGAACVYPGPFRFISVPVDSFCI